MRILHVIPSVSPVYGGPSTSIFEYASELRELGHQVDVVSTFGINDWERDGQTFAKLRYLGENSYRLRSSDSAREEPLILFRLTTQRYKFSLGLAFWLLKKVSEYDLLHIHGLFSFVPVWAGFCCIFRRKPFCIRAAGTLNKAGIALKARRKFMSYSILEKTLLKYASGIQFGSPLESMESLKFIGKDLGSKSFIFPPFDNFLLENDRNNLSPPKNYLLFVGRIDPIKNIESLLLALRCESIDSTRLVICGSGQLVYMQRLKKLAIQIGVDSQIDWVGWKFGSEKNYLINNAKAVVIPSFSESFSIVALEAMRRNIPILATRTCGILSFIDRPEDYFYLAESNPESIKAAIREVITLGRLGKKSYSEILALHFDKNNLVRDLAKRYEQYL